MLQFQFKKPITDVLSRVLLRTFSGVDKVWIIAEDPDKENFALYQTNQNEERAQLVEEVEMKKDNYLNNRHFYRWISLDETPLSNDKEVRIQYNIFDEYKNSILHLFLPPEDGEFLVFYIFFNEQHALSGPNSDSRLSTDNKQLVAHTVYNLLREVRNTYVQDRQVSENLNKMQQRMSKFDGNAHLKSFMQAYVNNYLETVSIHNSIRLSITPDAIEYLFTQALTPALLTSRLSEAVAWLLNFGNVGQTRFLIERIHIADNTSTEISGIKAYSDLHEEKYNRSYELLEKLEHAALKVINAGQKLTGFAVGQAFETPISAPAITDALKKHAGKLRTLTRIYPDKWPIIRNQFKPIQNVLDEDSGQISIKSA